jgi:CheY-like chemotaxis protein
MARAEPLPPVLIADDDETIRMLLTTVLSRDGRFGEVTAVVSGLQAVEEAGLKRPAIIVLDLGMWDLSGYEALPLLKSRCPEAAIVIYSAAVDKVDAEPARRRGADAVIPKTTPVVDLPDLLLNVLAEKRLR